MSRISFTWSTRREGNVGYVLEESSSGLKREYGPMPSHVVPAFVQGRRTIVATMLSDADATPIPDADYDYLHASHRRDH